MNPSVSRSRSLPPLPVIDLHRVDNSRIGKSRRMSFQVLSKEPDNGICLSNLPSIPSRTATASRFGSAPSVSRSVSPASANLSPDILYSFLSTANFIIDKMTGPPASANLSPEISHSFLSTANIIVENTTGHPLLIEYAKTFDSVFEAAGGLIGTGMPVGLYQTSKIHPKRREQKRRRAIIRQACEDRPIEGGKPLPEHRLLALYGRRELPLDGQWAANDIMDEKARCKQCQALQFQCIVVMADRFWTRSQCASCVYGKKACSLDIKGNNKEG